MIEFSVLCRMPHLPSPLPLRVHSVVKRGKKDTFQRNVSSYILREYAFSVRCRRRNGPPIYRTPHPRRTHIRTLACLWEGNVNDQIFLEIYAQNQHLPLPWPSPFPFPLLRPDFTLTIFMDSCSTHHQPLCQRATDIASDAFNPFFYIFFPQLRAQR